MVCRLIGGMDVDELAPEDEAELRQRQQELLEDTRRAKQELEQQQNEALAAIAEDEELEDYETVTLGDLELEVKGWMPGDTTDIVQRAMELAKGEDTQHIRQSMSIMLEALDDMTTSDTYNIAFWRAYYQEWGPSGMIKAVETVLGPAMNDMQAKQEARQSFRGDGARDGFRDGVQHDGGTSE